ncbi:TPA: hypothetical protein N0F65_011603 [Lagenidium giganteum]|uniref:Peptidase C1A papain C-terminal domain-containing protein n=1 Tax=Lagenidium giganteum TaxID=4803 RepID=A0AAV2ZCS5_9STRA|nr:TPA: hypothetical protein N0F65_011603 [Lagenidium giganteum]
MPVVLAVHTAFGSQGFLRRKMRALKWACLAVIGGAVVARGESELGFGTLASCTSGKNAKCEWVGQDGALVDGRTLQEQMIVSSDVKLEEQVTARRNLEQHIQYIEDVQRYAAQVGHYFSYHMGVNERHLLEAETRTMLPHALVHQEMRALRASPERLMSRRLQSNSSSNSGTAGGGDFNWCTSANPKKKSVCTGVKSQARCGSCWAFAASDAIETAVAVASGNTPTPLSPQQLLGCSTRDMDASFTYCWAKDGVSGSPWMSSTIKWKSKNNACDGGMTHGAFQDVAQLHMKLGTELEIPYEENSGSNLGKPTCKEPKEAAASITGWKQTVGPDCSASSDPSVLLRKALQDQPIAVAINSKDPFKDYKGGFYSCPNGGDLASKDDVNHALLLVGYGTDPTAGDYWVLKNSYGTQWGDKGFLKLVADKKLNCGLNVFPVIPTGAQAGVANVAVDSGGDEVFLGLSFSSWIVVAVICSVATVLVTIGGVFYQRQRRANIRGENGLAPVGNYGNVRRIRDTPTRAGASCARVMTFDLIKRVVLACASASLLMASALGEHAWKDYSFGTLAHCEDGQRCLWVDDNGELVDGSMIVRKLMDLEQLDMATDHSIRRRLEENMQYIEDVQRIAVSRGLSFNYRMGVNTMHLYQDNYRGLSAEEFVTQEFHATRRRLTEVQEPVPASERRLADSLPDTLNWCSTENPLKKSICTTIKSQNKCGSCWAFAATDAIETAVAVAGKSTPQTLSPQQFLECSRRSMSANFQYCWVSDKKAEGAPWLNSEMRWASQNNGCDGGMTHGAFADAAQSHLNLLTMIDLPYKESDDRNIPTKSLNASCSPDDSRAAASIEGWEQAVGKHCSQSKDSSMLLKIALQKQPISVAINSGSQFKDYKGGIYDCPNNGDITSSSAIDHAVVLVGYGNDGSGEYWILKNSYSSQWGEKGFLKLRMDKKINCGVSVFPVIPTGARAGAAKLSVDGGGDEIFLGLPFSGIDLERYTASSMSTRYVDEASFERYDGNDGQEITVTQLVPLAPADAFDSWLKNVWLAKEATIVAPGSGRGRVGCVRRMPLGLVEEILAAGLPTDREDEIPSILYTIREYGPFPLNDHIGYVRFVADPSGKSTLVVWNVKTTPTMMGNVFCCGGSIIRLGLRSALSYFLSSFASLCHSNSA